MSKMREEFNQKYTNMSDQLLEQVKFMRFFKWNISPISLSFFTKKTKRFFVLNYLNFFAFDLLQIYFLIHFEIYSKFYDVPMYRQFSHANDGRNRGGGSREHWKEGVWFSVEMSR